MTKKSFDFDEITEISSAEFKDGADGCQTNHNAVEPKKAAETYARGKVDFLKALATLDQQFVNAATNVCKSPIERILLGALVWNQYTTTPSIVGIWDSIRGFEKPPTDVVIAPSYHTNGYCVDFAVFINARDKEPIKIAVECDGYDYHSSPEQLMRDKRRDRTLEIAGWRMMRFTGSEITANAESCAKQVAELVKSELRRSPSLN